MTLPLPRIQIDPAYTADPCAITVTRPAVVRLDERAQQAPARALAAREANGAAAALERRPRAGAAAVDNLLAQRAGERLDLGLGDVVRVATIEHGYVNGDASVVGDGLEYVTNHRAGEVSAD